LMLTEVRVELQVPFGYRESEAQLLMTGASEPCAHGSSR
jgi:hypothetical protein